jgi:hypothetical protein
MTGNFRFNMGGTGRLPLDEYQTPCAVTRGLVERLWELERELKGPVLEPASGCGLMAAELRRCGLKVATGDINRGRDFLKRREPWKGDLVTNPPYRDRLDERFLDQAFELVSGKICLLMQTNRIHGQRRLSSLWTIRPPSLVLAVPWRIIFLEGDGVTPIKGQVYDHSWFMWDKQYPLRPGEQPRLDWLRLPKKDKP